MSTYNENESNKPFKTVMVEYFEEFASHDEYQQQSEEVDENTPGLWDDYRVFRPRRIKVVTTIQLYNMGSSKGDPIVSVTYEYL